MRSAHWRSGIWGGSGAALAALLMVGCGGGDASKGGSPATDAAAPPRFSVVAGIAKEPASMAGDEAQSIEPPSFNTEAYDEIVENEFLDVLQHPQSTFSIDVDTASYSNVRRMLRDGDTPPPGAVRIEELVNYFGYDYEGPQDEHPFHVSADLGPCPWTPQHRLLRVALKGREIEREELAAVNLVFLLDVSGSMRNHDKLPLVQSAMRLLVEQLRPEDRVAIVVYAGASGLVLPSTPVSESTQILAAIGNLRAGGSTNGGEGIELAYSVARDHFVQGGINRVVLCTDGDFNVGVTDESRLVRLIEEKAASGVFLSVLGFGKGNLKDATMEKLADKGNGNYAYIDSLLEARKVLVEQIGGTLVTIAKDVKIQLDFNPARIVAYRLLGYENRLLANEDFRDDSKDAGELGSGHTVTALYELVPTGVESPAGKSAPSKFVETKPAEGAEERQLLQVSLRYKQPDADASQEFSVPLRQEADEAPEADSDFQFAAAVAAFGMLLRESKFAGDATWEAVIETAESNVGPDPRGLRAEFVQLCKTARRLADSAAPQAAQPRP